MSRTPLSRPSAADAPTLSSGELCRAGGVGRGTLRVYEREGLLGPPPRAANGYRRYPADAAMRLQAIRQLKAVGFTLREIGWLMSERDAAGGLAPAQIRQLAGEQVQAIDQRIAQLQVVREMVAAVAGGDFSPLEDPGCDFLLRFLQAGQAEAVRRRR